ncbi:MAG: HPF/RaiA family ribosome-associated protein [Gammaproteobacteria bacterium]
MASINIQTKGLELNEHMQKCILRRIHSVFGFSKHEIQKIVITLLNENEHDARKLCNILVKPKGLPTISTQLESLDIYTAISLAIERAHLKLERRNINDKTIEKQLENNKKISLYGSHSLYK